MNVTAKIKINVDKSLLDTIKVFKRGLQFCVDTAWSNKIKNNVKLHPLVYQDLRAMGLPSQLAISCIKQSCGIVKKPKNKPLIQHASIKYNFPRSARFKNNLLSISTINGRIEIPFKVPKCYEEYFSDWKVCESIFFVNKKGTGFFCFTFSKEVNTNQQELHSQNKILGVDLGVNNLAVTSDGVFYNNGRIKHLKRRFKFLRGKLQSKGTRSAKKLLRKISGRERRFMTWVNHNVSKNITTSLSKGDVVVFEDLKGIRNRGRGKRFNSMLSNWSFYQLQTFVEYKSEKRGVLFKKVPPNYTSQLCSRCGLIGNRVKHFFSCSSCGYSCNADLNASRNIAHPKLGERQVAVTQPRIQRDDIKDNSDVVIAIERMDKAHAL